MQYILRYLKEKWSGKRFWAALHKELLHHHHGSVINTVIFGNLHAQ